MTVVVSPEAVDDLDAIWRGNVGRYSVAHADDYLAFLPTEIAPLVTAHPRALTVPGSPSHSYALMRRTARGHGHVAVFQMDRTVINVLRVYHKAQDWQRDVGP